MKVLRFWITVFGTSLVLALFGVALEATDVEQQKISANFSRTTILGGAMLRGDYLIVHDDKKAEKGEPCLLVFRDRTDVRPDDRDLVAAVHCVRTVRETAKRFKIVTESAMQGVDRVREVQFAGSQVAHTIP